MQKYDFGGYQVETDKMATLNWYEKAGNWGCNCGHCRNFLALANERVLPAPVIAVLDEVGIPPQKATYVCNVYTDDRGMHYQFSYRMAGRILKMPEQAHTQCWGQIRCCHEPYPYGAPNFPEPHFDLEFWTILPWVLEESPDGQNA